MLTATTLLSITPAHRYMVLSGQHQVAYACFAVSLVLAVAFMVTRRELYMAARLFEHGAAALADAEWLVPIQVLLVIVATALLLLVVTTLIFVSLVCWPCHAMDGRSAAHAREHTYILLGRINRDCVQVRVCECVCVCVCVCVCAPMP